MDVVSSLPPDTQATEAVQPGDRSFHDVPEDAKAGAVWPTLAGDLDLEIPKVRTGSVFLSLRERRRRIDQALYDVIMEAYVYGVSTRSVDNLVTALGGDSGISKSEVLRICTALTAFHTRPLDHVRSPLSSPPASPKTATARSCA